jgi:hypothetical protein
MSESDVESSEAALVRRAAECWQAGAPTSGEIRRAARRFAARGVPKRPVGRLLAVALVQGFTVGVVTLAAASWVVMRSVSPVPGTARGIEHPGGHSGPLPKHTLRLESSPEVPEAPAPHAAFADLALPGATGSDGSSGSRHVEPQTAPPGARVAPGTASGPVSRGPNVGASHSSGVVAAPPPVVVGDAVDGRWAKVAEALSANDFRSADGALAELGRSADATTRDAAELARAQLRVAHGGGEPLRPSLERLAREGSTPLVRRRAAELLGVLGASSRGTVPR